MAKKGNIPWNKGLNKNDPRVARNAENCRKTRIERNNYTAWNKGKTKETDERVLKNWSATQDTLIERYGVINPGQLNHDAWNKGLTKETDDRVAKISKSNKGKEAWNKGISTEGHPHSEETKELLRQIHLDPEFQKQRYEKMKKNGTFSISKPEEDMYKELCEQYGEDNVIRQYRDERYPFACDFYIPSEDLFIELNACWTHGPHPFDENNKDDVELLNEWKEKSQTSQYYKNAIYTWTELDVRKQKIAKENNLKYKVIYS